MVTLLPSATKRRHGRNTAPFSLAILRQESSSRRPRRRAKHPTPPMMNTFRTALHDTTKMSTATDIAATAATPRGVMCTFLGASQGPVTAAHFAANSGRGYLESGRPLPMFRSRWKSGGFVRTTKKRSFLGFVEAPRTPSRAHTRARGASVFPPLRPVAVLGTPVRTRARSERSPHFSARRERPDAVSSVCRDETMVYKGGPEAAEVRVASARPTATGSGVSSAERDRARTSASRACLRFALPTDRPSA